jgi:hypothetical protein
MSYEAMEYQGFEYLPDVLEDEDTRRYIHTVYQAGVLVGQIDKTHWYPAKFEDFKQFVDCYIKEHA